MLGALAPTDAARGALTLRNAAVALDDYAVAVRLLPDWVPARIDSGDALHGRDEP